MDTYRKEILDMFKKPKNFGTMKGADIDIDEVNVSCGDEIKMQVKLDKDKKKIKKVMYVCYGCLVCVTASSVLTQIAEGKTIKEVEAMTFDDINKVLKIKVHPGKIHCINLGLKALKNGVKDYDSQKN